MPYLRPPLRTALGYTPPYRFRQSFFLSAIRKEVESDESVVIRGGLIRGVAGADDRKPRLVFIDATWTKMNMAPFRGWAPRGARLVAKVPHGHWKTLTFVAALRHDRIEARSRGPK